MQNYDTYSQVTETVVGPSVKIQGDLNSEGNIRIQGHVQGTVKTTETVFVEETAKLTADCEAGTMIVAGEIFGNIKVGSKLVMQPTGKIEGDVITVLLQVEEGAIFNGKITMQSK